MMVGDAQMQLENRKGVNSVSGCWGGNFDTQDFKSSIPYTAFK